MLKVTIELWPHGDEERKRTLGTIDIWNDATGTHEVGNYTVRLSKELDQVKKKGGAWRKGKVTGFARLKKGPYDLLYLALKACGMDQRNPA